MRQLWIREFIKSLSVLLFLTLPSSSGAQSMWSDTGRQRAVSLEILKPDKGNTTFWTSTTFVSLRLPFRTHRVFVVEVPFSHFQTDFANFDSEADNQFGNPYLGLELHQDGSPVFLEAGIRLPVVASASNAVRFGQLTDADRLEAFSPDAFTVLAAWNYRRTHARGHTVRLRFGPNLLLRTGDGGFTLLTSPTGADDSELYLTFMGQLGFSFGAAHLASGLTGRLLVTDDGNLGRRTFLQLGFDVGVQVGRFRPAVHATIPVEDDLREVVKLILGFNVNFKITAD